MQTTTDSTSIQQLGNPPLGHYASRSAEEPLPRARKITIAMTFLILLGGCACAVVDSKVKTLSRTARLIVDMGEIFGFTGTVIGIASTANITSASKTAKYVCRVFGSLISSVAGGFAIDALSNSDFFHGNASYLAIPFLLIGTAVAIAPELRHLCCFRRAELFRDSLLAEEPTP